ncbi:acyltransferase family protein [Nocardioides aequoreus]|uniref:acyltransferase family protein n=1 Tax=Nocardioides aequoreus TaxID=397278 RepID=UPI00146FD4F3|nr:acyltransferase [Nocardioides aequoreus]
MNRLPALDTLRAVGALAVLTTHAAFWAGAYTGHGLWGTVLARLDVGVAIFFALSGFLLARPWLAAAQEGRPSPRAGRYLWHRFLRIMPLYAVTVVLALSLISANADRDAGDWVVTLLLLDTFVHPSLPDGLTQMWSLAVEVTFYLVLPLLMVAVVGRPGRPRLGRVRLAGVLAAMVVLGAVWHVVAVPRLEGVVGGQPAQWLPGYLSWFAVGIGIAAASVRHDHGSTSRTVSTLVTLGRQPGACWVAALGLLLLTATPLAGPTMLAAPTTGEAVFKHLVYAGVGALLLLPAVFAGPGGFRTVFEARPLRRLGQISYGVFCLHLPLLHLVMWTTGWELFDGRLAQIWLLTVVASLVAAELGYRLVELPAMRWRGLGSSRSSSSASASAARTGSSASS